MPLSREDILAAPDLKTETVPVPEWKAGETVLVRGISAADHERFQVWLAGFREDISKAGSIRCGFLVYCLVDEQGQRLFGDEGGAEELGRKNPAVIARLYETAQALSGLGPSAVEDAAKN